MMELDMKNPLENVKNLIVGNNEEGIKQEVNEQTSSLKEDVASFYIQKLKQEKNFVTSLAMGNGDKLKNYLVDGGITGFGSRFLLKIVDQSTADELEGFKSALDTAKEDVLSQANETMTKKELEDLLGIIQPQDTNPNQSSNTTVIPLPITTGKTENKIELYDGKYAFPVSGDKKSITLTSLFGSRNHPISGKSHEHTGVDIGAPLGTPLLAMIDGEVLKNTKTKAGGRELWIKGKDGRTYAYLHMKEQSKLLQGTKVTAGKEIGLMGSTGSSTGSHLHLTIKDTDNENIDPILEFPEIFTDEHMNISDFFLATIQKRQLPSENMKLAA